MTRALLLVDLQNDYFPGGAMELVGMEAAAERARAVLSRYREVGDLVFHVQHLSTRPGATFFLPGTSGAEHHESVRPGNGEAVFRKHFPNAFRDTGLRDALKKHAVEEVAVCGAMSHMCIDATTRAAFDEGFRCTVVDDACATRDLERAGERLPAAQVHAVFMAALAVPYAAIVKAEDLLHSA